MCPLPCVPPARATTNAGENADTLAALPRVWAHSLGGQRTTGERTTSRPNTQPGLPSNHHLWKLPRSEPSPRRSAARWRRAEGPFSGRYSPRATTFSFKGVAGPPATGSRPSTAVLLPTVRAISTTDRRMTTRPCNLSRAEPSPRRCAARCRPRETRWPTSQIHCGKLLVPRRSEDDGLLDAAVGRARGPAGWLADGPRRAQTVLALREPDPSGSMGLVVSRPRTWVRCGTRPARPSAAAPVGDEIPPYARPPRQPIKTTAASY
jgi:hypothetical protein